MWSTGTFIVLDVLDDGCRRLRRNSQSMRRTPLQKWLETVVYSHSLYETVATSKGTHAQASVRLIDTYSTGALWPINTDCARLSSGKRLLHLQSG